MLDLETRIHLQEIEIAPLVGDELGRARGVVAHGLGECHRLRAHGRARLLVEQRRGRFLDHLLVAALNGAFALAQVNDVAVLVAQHLDLDVARIEDEFLDEDARIAEGRLRLVRRGLDGLGEILCLLDEAHAFAAAAGRGLDHDGKADFLGDALCLRRIGDLAQEPRHRRDIRGAGELLRLDLVAHGGDRARMGADEGDAGIAQRLRKASVLGEEAVARMHGLGTRLLRGGDDAVDDEIRLRGLRRADSHGLVRHFDMGQVLVGLGIDRDRLDPHAFRRAHDAAGDLSPIGDEDFLEHQARGPSTRRNE